MERQLYERESSSHLLADAEDWDVVEREYMRDKFWRGVLHKVAATCTMAFVVWLIVARYQQVAAARKPASADAKAPAAALATQPVDEGKSPRLPKEKKEKKEKAPKEAKPKEAPKEDKAAKEAAKAAEKLRAKCVKEGGKKGVEIEGAADMGGLEFFCTTMEFPDGDVELLQLAMTVRPWATPSPRTLPACTPCSLTLFAPQAMNAQPDEGAEDRKGCSGRVGKMIFSAGVKQLAAVAYVPEAFEDKVPIREWCDHVCAAVAGEVTGGPTAAASPDGGLVAEMVVLADPDAGKFPLKDKDAAMQSAFAFLRAKGAFPEDKSDGGDDECCFGDDAFDEMNGW